MSFLLIVGIPTLIIVGLVITLKLKPVFSFIAIISLGYLSTYSGDYAYEILKPYIVDNIKLTEQANDQKMMQWWMNL